MGPLDTTVVQQRPRGRPQRLPIDPTPFGDPGLDSSRRVAWMLATSRLLSPSSHRLGRTAFIEEMRSQGVVLDASRVSRWESGTQPVARPLIAAYESVVGAPPGSLQATCALIRRTSPTAPRQPDPGAVEVADQLDAIFDRVETHEASGADWLDLAIGLNSYDRVYLHPASWEALTDQLVSELTRSSGLAAVRRYEAAAELLAQPHGGRFLSRSVGRFVMDRDAQSVAPALTLLREVSDASAGDLVLRLMGAANGVLRRGATGVAGAMAARGRFPDDAAAALEAHATQELRKGGNLARRTDAIDLATHLPVDSFDRIVAGVSDPRVRDRLEGARESMELIRSTTSRGYAESVASAAEAALGRAAHDPDQMLRRLVREALFHAHRERRNLAAVMLSASPYAAAVSHAVLRLTDEDEMVASLAWSLLRRMGHVLRRDDVAALALAEQRRGLRARALITLGLSHGRLDDDVAVELSSTASTATSNGLRHAAVFALGLSGHRALHQLSRHEDADVARAARWWSEVGPALHDLD